jgi:hypothetical protein
MSIETQLYHLKVKQIINESVSNIDKALAEIKQLIKDYLRMSHCTDKTLAKYFTIDIENDTKICISCYDYMSIELINIAQAVLKKYHSQHLDSDIELQALATNTKHTIVKIAICFHIAHT